MAPDPLSPHRRSQLDLTRAQLDAIDAWNRAQHVAEAATEAATVAVAMSREMRLDLSRRLDARRREQDAVIARARQQLEESGGLLPARARTRAVLAHRNTWFRDSVAKGLEAVGIVVVGVFEDGADAAGTIVVEQPDLVLVEERLPTLSGVEVVRRVRTYAPTTVVGAQCQDADGISALVAAGAQAVFTRRIPPRDIADLLVECMAGRGVPVTVS